MRRLILTLAAIIGLVLTSTPAEAAPRSQRYESDILEKGVHCTIVSTSPFISPWTIPAGEEDAGEPALVGTLHELTCRWRQHRGLELSIVVTADGTEHIIAGS